MGNTTSQVPIAQGDAAGRDSLCTEDRSSLAVDLDLPTFGHLFSIRAFRGNIHAVVLDPGSNLLEHSDALGRQDCTLRL